MSDSWGSVLTRARKCIVQIRTLTARHFDGNDPGPSLGTGFVVDKRLGIIMTNRHVISTAPVQLEAVFLNDEEVEAEALYIDPLHDFGFCKIDPKKIKYMAFDELPLRPENAKTGVEVRVIGSDAGEKTMVLRGTISRTDRTPPEYEIGSGFADHNTFYLTASCDTSGGSSGSPVLDKSGSVVALNAGAAVEAASSFFLPLDRAVKALKVIQSCLARKDYCIWNALPRGTLQCVFDYVPMPECNRLGVTKREETEIRKALTIGTHLLVVQSTIPDGPADRAGLCPGDVLLKVNGEYLNQYSALEDILDEAVGSESAHRELKFEFKRGGKRFEIANIEVSDAYEAIPSAFLSFSKGVIHRIGFSTAMDFRLPLSSLVIESSGYAMARAGMEPGTIIQSIENEPVKSLEDLERILSSRKDGENVLVRCIHLYDRHTELLLVLPIDRKWHLMSLCRRSPDRFSRWTYTDSPPPPSTAAKQSTTLARPASFRVLKANDYTSAQERVFKSLVIVTYNAPYPLDGIAGMSYLGTGYICSKEHGLVLTDRNTVIGLLGDVVLDIAFAYKVKAKVIYLHPFQNIAIVKYDPLELGETQVEQLDLFDATTEGEGDLKRGDVLEYFGFTSQLRTMHLTAQKVVGFERGDVATSFTPRFAAKNFDQVKFEKLLPADSIGGMFVDTQGRARCISASYSVGELEQEVFLNALITPAARAVKTVIQCLEEGKSPVRDLCLYSLACEFGIVQLHEARYGLKLPEDWAKKVRLAANEDYSGAGSGTREVLQVFGLMAGTGPARQLKVGDLVLAADGVPLVSYLGFEMKAHEAGKEHRKLKVTVLRKAQVQSLDVDLAALSCAGTRRAACFAGFLCQETHDSVRWHSFVPPFLSQIDEAEKGKKGVYISSIESGSPAHRTGIPPTRWITEIQECPVYNLDDMLRVTKKFKHRDRVRVRSLGIRGDEAVTMHELDLVHFPTHELVLKESNGGGGEEEWERVMHAREMTL